MRVYSAPAWGGGYKSWDQLVADGNVIVDGTVLDVPDHSDPNSLKSFNYIHPTLIIPDGITRIEDLFNGLTISRRDRLYQVVIPNSVTEINYDVFCQDVYNIVYNGTFDFSYIRFEGTDYEETEYAPIASLNGYIEGDFVYSDSTKTTLRQYIGSENTVVIPDTVTSIRRYRDPNNNFCISGSYSLGQFYTDIQIPNTVTDIQDWSFKNVKHIEYHGSATGSPWGAEAIN